MLVPAASTAHTCFKELQKAESLSEASGERSEGLARHWHPLLLSPNPLLGSDKHPNPPAA